MTEKILLNGTLIDRSEFDPEVAGADKYIYEVIRMIGGKILFLEEHYERLIKSLAASKLKVNFSPDKLRVQMHTLAEANELLSDSVKLIIDNVKGESDYDVCLLNMHTKYPGQDDYMHGVDTEFFNGTRTDPHVKSHNQSLRDATNEAIKEYGVFEVILVDGNGNVTEGSRSNIFFIKDGVIYTSPSQGVLLGVTRRKVLEICAKNGIDVVTSAIKADEVSSFDAAFISGTSPKVLPIRSIGDVKLNVDDPLLQKLMCLYDDEIERCLE